jgi:hypothetical protein
VNSNTEDHGFPVGKDLVIAQARVVVASDSPHLGLLKDALEQLDAAGITGEVIGGKPALPVTDNQLRQFYLDWVNNFCSTEGCAEFYGITQDEAKAFIERGKALHELATNYHVAAVSSNTNSFGYKSVLALNAHGLGVQLLVQAYGTDEVPKVGDVVTLGESRFYGAPTKLPSVTPEKAAKLIKTLTK